MTVKMEFQRTRLDECFDEARTILKANGVTLEMAMAKLLERKQEDHKLQEAEAKTQQRVKMGRTALETTINKQALILGAALLPFVLAPASIAAPRSSGEVVIINTGDRVTPGYRVTVEPSGALASALVPTGQRKAIRRTNKLIALNRRRFFADLASAGPLGSLPGNGAGSLPAIYVRYHAQQSPNLRTASSQSGQLLYQDVKQILQVLRLPIPDSP